MRLALGPDVVVVILVRYSLGKWWRHLTFVMMTRGNRFQTNSLEHKHDESDSCVHLLCVFYQWQRHSSSVANYDQHLSLLWLRKTKIQDRIWTLVLVGVLWITIPRIYWQFWQSFFKLTFRSSSTFFYPIGITWRNGVGPVCLKPVVYLRYLVPSLEWETIRG